MTIIFWLGGIILIILGVTGFVLFFLGYGLLSYYPKIKVPGVNLYLYGGSWGKLISPNKATSGDKFSLFLASLVFILMGATFIYVTNVMSS